MSGIIQALLASLAASDKYELYGWGNGGSGELNRNLTTSVSSPVKIGTATDWSYVSAGSSFSIAVKTNGTLWSFGRNTEGRLGDNTIVYKSSPVQIGALTNWDKVASGNQHTLAIKTNGTMWAWGANGSSGAGRLGDGTVINRSSPVQIGALTTWAQVSAGILHSLAVKTDGTLWVWGSNNRFALGSSTPSLSSPVQLGALTNWSQATGGRDFSLAVKTDNTLWAWGDSAEGQLGVNAGGFGVTRSSPVQVGALTDWAKVSAAYQRTVAVKTNGTLWAMGSVTGDGTNTQRSSPVQIGALTTWSDITRGSRREFHHAIKTDGTLWGWGSNGSGQVGNYSTYPLTILSPVQVGSLTTWHQVAGGNAHSIALTKN